MKSVSFDKNIKVINFVTYSIDDLDPLLFKLPLYYKKKLKPSKFLVYKITTEVLIFEKFFQPFAIKNLMIRGEKKYLERKYGIIFEPEPIQIKDTLEKYDLFINNNFKSKIIFDLNITTMHEYCRLSISCRKNF